MKAAKKTNGQINSREIFQMMSLVSNAFNTTLARRNLLRNPIDPRRDIDDECGYPKVVDAEQYRFMYDREGIAQRVVGVYPEESWAMDPEIFETEEPEETEFEMVWAELRDKLNVYHYLHRIDELSGIGHYGILLLGLNDGGDLNQPVEGLNERGEKVGVAGHQLLFLRSLDESLVQVSAYERDQANPRFGQPTLYDVIFNDPRTIESGAVVSDTTQHSVHWSRLIHVADNRKSSEVFGTPRMRPVFNRLYDLRKLLGGSAEMFWKGAFPGYSFEVHPDASDAEIDKPAMKEEIEDFSNGLQRYLTLSGMTARSLAPQVASPEAHVKAQIEAIAITLSIPMRILIGSEAAHLASTQDKETWNARLVRRQTKYLTPMLVRPFIDRMIAFGILPEPKKYTVVWPDLLKATDEDRAKVADLWTKALANYVKSGVEVLVPPMEFFTIFLEMPLAKAEAILTAAEEQISEEEVEIEEESGHEEEEEENTSHGSAHGLDNEVAAEEEELEEIEAK